MIKNKTFDIGDLVRHKNAKSLGLIVNCSLGYRFVEVDWIWKPEPAFRFPVSGFEDFENLEKVEC